MAAGKKPFYASLLKRVLPFLADEGEVVALPEMVEVIAFLDAANRSRKSQTWKTLQTACSISG